MVAPMCHTQLFYDKYITHYHRCPIPDTTEARCRAHRAARVRATASSKYSISISMPTKFNPSCAAATAVEPNPIKGSATVPMRPHPCSRRHISGSFVGNVAGCGRSVFRF